MSWSTVMTWVVYEMLKCKTLKSEAFILRAMWNCRGLEKQRNVARWYRNLRVVSFLLKNTRVKPWEHKRQRRGFWNSSRERVVNENFYSLCGWLVYWWGQCLLCKFWQKRGRLTVVSPSNFEACMRQKDGAQCCHKIKRAYTHEIWAKIKHGDMWDSKIQPKDRFGIRFIESHQSF